MPLPETIPTSYVILTSALLTGFIAYQSRKNGLETQWERERFINSRLAGSMRPSNTWGIKFDQVNIFEDSGLFYRFKKFVTGRMSGEATVTIQYQNASIHGEIWENENIQELLGVLDFDVEHIETVEQIEPTHAKFLVQTVKWEDIVEFVNTVIEIEKAGREEMAGHPQR